MTFESHRWSTVNVTVAALAAAFNGWAGPRSQSLALKHCQPEALNEQDLGRREIVPRPGPAPSRGPCLGKLGSPSGMKTRESAGGPAVAASRAVRVCPGYPVCAPSRPSWRPSSACSRSRSRPPPPAPAPPAGNVAAVFRLSGGVSAG